VDIGFQGSIVDTLQQRLDNYIKAITYVKKYDLISTESLLKKAEKLKAMQGKLRQGDEVDR
jgi:ribosome-interacting GTPase 1